MLPLFLFMMITMMNKTAITPATPPITAYNPLEDVSWISENKQEIYDNCLNYPRTSATAMTICDS
jgi:hypothetical protein